MLYHDLIDEKNNIEVIIIQLFLGFREHVCGERCASWPADQRTGHSGISRGHPCWSRGFTSRVPVSVVPVDPVLPGHDTYHDRCSGWKLCPTLPNARVLRQVDRHENHDAFVHHMDHQLDLGHVTVHLQVGTRLLCQKGTKSTFLWTF